MIINPFRFASGGSYPVSLAADVASDPAANGWVGGWFNTNGDPSSFTTSGVSYTVNQGWTGSEGFGTPVVKPFSWHPAYNPGKSAALKYIAQYAGTVSVTLKNVEALSSSVLYYLWKNGTQVGSSLAPSTGPADLGWTGVSVSVSDVIIIEMNPNGNAGNDTVGATDVVIG